MALRLARSVCYGSPASDTGGSIRWPCAATGLTGIKPTGGRVSRYGTFELAPTLDHIGTIAHSAADSAALLGVIAGHDPKDPMTLRDQLPDYLSPGDIPRQPQNLKDHACIGFDLAMASTDGSSKRDVRRARLAPRDPRPSTIQISSFGPCSMA